MPKKPKATNPHTQHPRPHPTPPTSLHNRCHKRRLLKAHLADNIAPWHTYAQARALQAQAHQPTDTLKVAKRDTEGARHTDNTPTQSRMAARRAPRAAVPIATDPTSKLRTTIISQRSGNW